MTPSFAASDAIALPLYVASPDTLDAVLTILPKSARAWATAQGYKAGAGAVLTLPGPEGSIIGAIVGLGPDSSRSRHRFIVGGAASKLPAGNWRLEFMTGPDLTEAALGWLLESYRFTRYHAQDEVRAKLTVPAGVDADRLLAIATGEYLTRDLINTPSSDMGPAELEQAARDLAGTHGAAVSVITGDDLLTRNFPMVHAVGRASTRPPRLIDMTWGSVGPTLTLVGKGVCFDTGGLDIKPAASMATMKKDMGGAATVLGLAHMIMSLKLPLRLRVLIPAVENSIDGNAFRPGDILTSRKGLTVEINNTDAEGRLVLADALALGSEAKPDLMISMATLTGAARVAVGADISPFFTDDDGHAAAIVAGGAAARDPVWRLPFYDPYEPLIEPGIADLDNAPGGGKAGAITAALFLRRFADAPYIHFDIYGSTDSAFPGRPKGGVGMGARAILDALPNLLGL